MTEAVGREVLDSWETMMSEEDTKLIESLAKAAFHNRIDEAKSLLKQGVDPNATVNSISILRYSVGQGDRPEMVRLLLEAGANPNGDPGRDEELVQSAACGLPKVLRVLLGAGSNLHWVNDEGRSALWYAVDGGQKECEAILREYGLDYTERELTDTEKARRLKNQQTIVMNRIRSTRTKDAQDLGSLMQEAVAVDLPKHVVKLLQKGAVPNFREEHDDPTPLVWAADKGYLDVVKAALEAGSPIDEKVFYD